jgi:hypothetical protein
MIALSTVLLLVFAVLAAIDGIYIHLIRLKLPSRPRSWMEHVWHTFSALLFLPIVLTIFLAPTAGVVLWTGVALVVALYWVEIRDVRAERESRADLGGLSRFELTLHVILILSRTAAVVLALTSRPIEAWSSFSTPVIGAHPGWVTLLVGQLVPGSLLIAAVHVYYAWRYRPAGCCALAA